MTLEMIVFTVVCGIIGSMIATYLTRFLDRKKHKKNRLG